MNKYLVPVVSVTELDDEVGWVTALCQWNALSIFILSSKGNKNFPKSFHKSPEKLPYQGFYSFENWSLLKVSYT